MFRCPSDSLPLSKALCAGGLPLIILSPAVHYFIPFHMPPPRKILSLCRSRPVSEFLVASTPHSLAAPLDTSSSNGPGAEQQRSIRGHCTAHAPQSMKSDGMPLAAVNGNCPHPALCVAVATSQSCFTNQACKLTGLSGRRASRILRCILSRRPAAPRRGRNRGSA